MYPLSEKTVEKPPLVGFLVGPVAAAGDSSPLLATPVAGLSMG